jgi:hypothetical protein
MTGSVSQKLALNLPASNPPSYPGVRHALRPTAAANEWQPEQRGARQPRGRQLPPEREKNSRRAG